MAVDRSVPEPEAPRPNGSPPSEARITGTELEEIAIAEANLEALEAGDRSAEVEETAGKPPNAAASRTPEPPAGLTAEVREPAQRATLTASPADCAARCAAPRPARNPGAAPKRAVTARNRRPYEAPGATAEKPAPSISDLLKEGQEMLVQIAKEPLGQKGARITSHIALPGRYVVYMPTVDHMGVSARSPPTKSACG